MSGEPSTARNQVIKPAHCRRRGRTVGWRPAGVRARSGWGGEAVAGAAHRLAALSYAASTFQRTPAALAQPGGIALGAQAAPAAIRQLADDAGFSRFRQVAQTPVNVVLELRP
jgi:hypothetical protein